MQKKEVICFSIELLNFKRASLSGDHMHNTKGSNLEAAKKLESTIFEGNGSKMVAETKKGLAVTA